jgi:hypothetical protein
LKEKFVRMYPYGGYDPFSTPSAKAFSQSSVMPDRPPFASAPSAPAASFPQQFPPGYNQGYMPYMPPMMPPGIMPHPMMQQGMGMPFMQQGQGKQNQMAMSPFNQQQGSGITFSKAMGGANQVMGLAQQMGNILSLFK